ncbi:response regulator transcription factor [Paenibacillus sp. GCM10023250]|uniref:response regulator transcription factor n=1 Tax=Paenibacillus sp. GCM10023250 TaxID=3252648 RepID=UPI003611D476
MDKRTILVVEDEKALSELLVYALEREGFAAASAGSGTEAANRVRASRPDLILLDLMLPDMSGFDLCRTASREGWNIPIIMLTAKSDMVDKLLGMELGADDYITKPFDVREVVVRIKAVFRRIEQVIGREAAQAPETIALRGDIEIRKAQRLVCREGTKIELKNKEFELLLFFAEHRGIVFTRPQLLNRVWGYDFAGDTRTVDIHVQRLRKKLDKPGEVSVIDTVFAVGYRMP